MKTRSSVLQQIMVRTQEEVVQAKQQLPYAILEEQARAQQPVRGFTQRLHHRVQEKGYAFITEIKKSAPSTQHLSAIQVDSAAHARLYEEEGAACISVLTNTPYFQGSAEDLIAARRAVRLPILRKDFILEPYQVVQSRAMGADAVLLMMACLSDDMALECYTVAQDWGMDVLVEVHDLWELERALRLKPHLLGINNRNLHTLSVDLSVTESLAPRVPKGVMRVSESGIASPQDITRVAASKVCCFLIGSSLMRAQDPRAQLQQLHAAACRAYGGGADEQAKA